MTKAASFEERFWARVDRRGPDECWPWLGAKANSYGRLSQDGRYRCATHVMWELTNGEPFPAGKLACHACDNPPCVNPAHLWVGTNRDNMLDRSAKGRCPNQQKTHCQRGHEYNEANTYTTSNGRHCRRCNNIAVTNYNLRKAGAQ